MSSSRHAKCKLPKISKPSSLPVRIPVKIIRPDSADRIIIRVKKVENDVLELQNCVAVESTAREDLTKRVEDLQATNVEIKKYVTEEAKEVRLKTRGGRAQSMQVFMKMLPCKTLIEFDTLRDCVEIRTISCNGLVGSILENRCLFLNSSGFQTEFVKLIGGSDFNTSIKMVLNATIDRSVQRQLSWTGQGTKKPSLKFNYKAIVDGIHVAMKDNFQTYTIAQGEEKFKKLLQSAK